MSNHNNFQTVSRKSSSHKPKSKRTDTHRIDPKFVGLIIGPGAATVISIAKDAGSGCRIRHDRENPGLFDLSAWDSNAIQRAIIKIDEMIKQASTQTRKVSKSQPKKKAPTNGFSALDSDEDDDGVGTNPQSKKGVKSLPSRRLGFTSNQPDIKALKRQGWLNGQAKQEKLKEFQATWESMSSTDQREYGSWNNFRSYHLGLFHKEQDKQARQTALKLLEPTPVAVTEYQPEDDSFPDFGKDPNQASIGAWGASLDGVKQEEPVPKPEKTQEKPKMQPIEKKQEPELAQKSLPTGPAKKFNTLRPIMPPRTQKPKVEEVVKVSDSWTDDEDDDYTLSTRPKMVGPAMGGFSGGGAYCDTSVVA